MKGGSGLSAGEWEYSLNGIDWIEYSDSLNSDASSSPRLFVRSKEAEGYKPSKAVLVGQ